MIKILIEKLKKSQYSLVALDENGFSYSDEGKGVKPIITPMRDNVDFFKDKLVADKIVGKASALLLSLSGAKYVYGIVMSSGAKVVFEKYGIGYSYDELVPYIENRTHDGMCPLECAVKDCDDKNEAFILIENKIKQLMEN